MPVRTFLALPLDEIVVEGLLRAQRALASTGARVRWVESDNLHLTIKFLGDVNDEGLDEVCRVAEKVASQAETFEFSVTGLRSVPPTGQMRMVWVDVVEPTGRLERLQAALEEAYAALGFKMENRAFRPHLTLGRVKSGKNVSQLREAVAEYSKTDFGIQSAEELIVFSSKLTPTGPVYSPLKTARLG